MRDIIFSTLVTVLCLKEETRPRLDLSERHLAGTLPEIGVRTLEKIITNYTIWLFQPFNNPMREQNRFFDEVYTCATRKRAIEALMELMLTVVMAEFRLNDSGYHD